MIALDEMKNKLHTPVLLNEAMDALAIKSDGIYMDGTFGFGGHSSAILNKLGPKGQLIAFDKDPIAIQWGQRNFHDSRLFLMEGSYINSLSYAKSHGLLGKFNGILIDSGVSSLQLDEATRGFSFKEDGPLDMRMNPNVGEPASHWLNKASQDVLTQIFKDYGEEPKAKAIAKRIIQKRTIEPLKTTKALADICIQVKGFDPKKKHPATQVFQAIRMYINQELKDLQTLLSHVEELLAPKGRLVVISFHSLEDALVKKYLKQLNSGDKFPIRVPVKVTDYQPSIRLWPKAIRPSEEEITKNPRSRSAIMRIAEKLP